MKDALTSQDKKFVERVVETGNQTLAAKEAYGIEDDNYAGKKGSLKVREGKIQNAIMSIAESIPDDLLSQKHLALLNKTDKEGNIDVQAVTKGLDMGYKLKGLYESDNRNINVFIPVLVKFLDKKDDTTDTTSDNGDTNRVS